MVNGDPAILAVRIMDRDGSVLGDSEEQTRSLMIPSHRRPTGPGLKVSKLDASSSAELVVDPKTSSRSTLRLDQAPGAPSPRSPDRIYNPRRSTHRFRSPSPPVRSLPTALTLSRCTSAWRSAAEIIAFDDAENEPSKSVLSTLEDQQHPLAGVVDDGQFRPRREFEEQSCVWTKPTAGDTDLDAGFDVEGVLEKL